MMTYPIDETHDPALQSWVESANTPATDFPLQNLPLGRFRRRGDPRWRIGVAIGDQVLDLRAAGLIDHGAIQQLIGAPLAERRSLRQRLSSGLRSSGSEPAGWRQALVAQAAIELGLPCEIGDYTDFYIGIYHATAVGRLYRPDNPLQANYKWVPIGYHGRASTVLPSGTSFARPNGQVRPSPDEPPRVAPTARLDFELELGIVIGRGNPLGQPIPIERAEEHIAGLALFNDWSARDIQSWEYQPLGPFLAKSFASTVSPWLVTMEALAPFRRAFTRPAGDPAPLPYLDAAANRDAGAFDIDLEVRLQTARMRDAGDAPARITRSNSAEAAYWTFAQLVTHHTVNGCRLASGDLFGSGTLSGPTPDQAASMLELSQGGKRAMQLANGEERTFLLDGDRVVLAGRCNRAGYRSIGFGTCEGTVTPAPTLSAT